MNKIATAIAGASSENAAIEAFQQETASCIAQHMQYLDITGTPKPRPKNWARKANAPKWWSDTLETEIEPLRLSRKPDSEIEQRFGNMKAQWARTYAEYLSHRVASGKSDSFLQASLDASLQLFQHAKREDIERMVSELPEEYRKDFLGLGGLCERRSPIPSTRSRWPERPLVTIPPLLTGGLWSQKPGFPEGNH